jgi:hypothetical protein
MADERSDTNGKMATVSPVVLDDVAGFSEESLKTEVGTA